MMKFVRRLGIALLAGLLPMASLAAAAPIGSAVHAKQAGAREGAEFIVGQWHVIGAYADAATQQVNFAVTFHADGTFVDVDNYTGRWLISGSSFSMYYPDESHLGYVGTINGGQIAGRFEGLHTAGVFSMTRR